MKHPRVPFVMLALVGAVLAFIGLYIQSVSMDLSEFSLYSYLAEDAHTRACWQAVALPLAVGASYVAVASACLIRQPTPRVTLLVFSACLAVAIALVLAGSGVGIYAAVTCRPSSGHS